MGASSAAELLVLHAVRLLGMATPGQAAARFGLPREDVEELLLDDQAFGFVQHVEFADLRGWALTDAGRHEDERRLAAELSGLGAREVVVTAHADFLPLNARLLDAITRWQLRPRPGEPLAANDHQDWAWDERALNDVRAVVGRVRDLEAGLAHVMERFAGYADRLDAALDRVDAGQRRWVDEPRIDSVHAVWMQLHEDLIATLGIDRLG